MGKSPPGELPVVVTVSVEVPDPEMVVGFKDAVTPAGWPKTVTLRSTVALNPFDGDTVITLVPDWPCVRLIVPGDGLMSKFAPEKGGPMAVNRLCPLGEPQPVTRSKPTTSENMLGLPPLKLF